MCCVLAILMTLGPRFAILLWWIIRPVYISLAFDNFIWGFLGWIFLPWTTLMYIAIYPGGITGFDWILMGMAVFADMAQWFGNYANRRRVPYGESVPSIDQYTR
jgi:hypothetical protein